MVWAHPSLWMMCSGVSERVMAITDLKAHLTSSGASEDGVNSAGLADRVGALEAEFVCFARNASERGS
jgi:hypothetical protein